MPDQVDWRALEREASPGRAVGRLLRDQREARGLSLGEVEKSLRIRSAHLAAIEDGQFDQLPGAAYVPAFLRAYAVHVGLDAEKVLSAYHLSGAVPIKRPVVMPADFPVVERRAPIGIAVLTVLLVLAAGYAAWTYLPREQTVIAEKVPPVPDRLLATRPSPEVAPVAPPSDPGSAAKPATPETRRTATDQPAPASNTLPANVWPGRRESVAPPTQNPSLEAPLAPPVVVAVPAPPPPPAVAAPSAGQAQAAQPPSPPETPRATVATPPTTAPAAAPAASAVEEATARPAPAEPATVAPVKVDTPLRVRTNSWVELRAPNGDILAQTYVRAGESYVIPAGIAYRVTTAR